MDPEIVSIIQSHILDAELTPHFVLVGRTGWLGTKLHNMLSTLHGIKVSSTKSRMENQAGILSELKSYNNITNVIIVAGISHGTKPEEKKNIDFCETHKIDTTRSNVLGTLSLIDTLYLEFPQTHVTHFATGCIYNYPPYMDETIPENVSNFEGFSETDEPNYSGSFYSKTKAIMEDLLASYIDENANLLILRIRMPIGELNHEDAMKRDLITKLIGFDKIINIQNSVTVLYELLPMSVLFAMGNKTGKLNLTNSGTISHNEILELYREYVDPSIKVTNFSVTEMSKILQAGRCNNKLNTGKLEGWYSEYGIRLKSAVDAVKHVFERHDCEKENNVSKPCGSSSLK